MKKLFRMALVLALAGSALLYTSCTKDYSPDISSLQEQIDAINNNTDGLPWVRQTLKDLQTDINNLKPKVTVGDDELQRQINELDGKIDDAIEDINDALDGKADKSDVDQKLQEVRGLITELQETLEERLDAIDGEEGRLAGLEEDVAILQQMIESLGTAAEAIDGQFQTYAKFIQSIAYVPATADGLLRVDHYYLSNVSNADHEVFDHWEYSWAPGTPRQVRQYYGTPQNAWNSFNGRQWVVREAIYRMVHANEAGDVSDTLIVATFKVTPADAVDRVTDASADLVAVQTKSAAAAPDTLVITKLIKRADAPGYVDVYAILGGASFDPNTFAVALSVTQFEEGLTESVTSDYAPAYINEEASNLKFEIFDNRVGDIVDPETEDDPVKVTPTTDPDSVNVFTDGRWTVVANFEGSIVSCEDAATIFGLKDAGLIAPAVGDTIVEVVEEDDNFAWHDYGFDSTVEPAEGVSVIDIINSNNREFKLALYLKNSHMVGDAEEDEGLFTPSGTVIGTYMAVPDSVVYNLTPVNKYGQPETIIIPWDYQYADDIKDTLIAKIKVDGDRDKLVGADETITWNKETNIDYTQGTGTVTAHSNDETAIDANLVSAAEYGEVDSTYVYSIRKFNPEDATEYVGNFEYIVEARPADVVVELGPVDTMVRFDSPTNFEVEAIVKAIAAHADAYANHDLEEVYADFADGVTVDSTAIYFEGERLGDLADYDLDYDEEDGDLSYLEDYINQVGEYKLYVYTHFAGVGYTFVLTVNAENNGAMIAPKAAYVTVDDAEKKNYSVEVKGDVDDEFHYYLIHQPFQDYLKVVEYDEGSEELQMDLQNITEMPEDTTVTEPDSPTGLVRLVEDPTTANLADAMIFEWGTWDSLAFEVAARLVPATENAPEGSIVDSATVKLWTKDPIPVFDGGEGIIVEHEKDSLAHTNIIAGINIKDLNGVALNDSTGLIKEFGPNEDGEIIVNYDQELEIGDIELVSGADYLEELDIYIEDDVLYLDLNQGVIVNDIVVKIPIKLTYMLDRGLDKTIWVYVTFTEKK